MASKKSPARRFLDDFEQFCIEHGTKPPYLHVSDPIRNDADLKKALSGGRLLYGRWPGHPDHVRIEKWLARFENGALFRIRSDGMNAINGVIYGAGEIRGPHFIFILPLYGGTYELSHDLAASPRHNFRFTYLSAADPDLPGRLYDAIEPHTAGVLFEISGNPTLSFPDVASIVRICKAHPAGQPIVICDNTFLFGLFYPFQWGVDVSVVSDTKYLGGESAWWMGHFGVSKNFHSECPEFWDKANRWANLRGGTQGIIESWITGKFSLRNLMRRIIQHSRNAATVAGFLEAHSCVERVFYPGLSSFPQRDHPSQYLKPIRGKHLYGGMISFLIKGDFDVALKFLYHLTKTTHIKNKASLAGPDDMIESPWQLSHRAYSFEHKALCGITPNLIRLSVGRIRPAEETIAALDRSLRKIVSGR